MKESALNNLIEAVENGTLIGKDFFNIGNSDVLKAIIKEAVPEIASDYTEVFFAYRGSYNSAIKVFMMLHPDGLYTIKNDGVFASIPGGSLTTPFEKSTIVPVARGLLLVALKLYKMRKEVYNEEEA